MVFDCTGKMMGEDLRPGNLINAKLELTVPLERGEDVRLFKGETLSKDLFVEFRKKGDDRKLWPVLLSIRNERILIEATPSGKALTVKYGQWNDRVSMIDGRNIRGRTGDYVDSTFTCSWSDLSSWTQRRIFDDETVRMGGFWMATAKSGKLTSSVSLSGCPYDTKRDRQQAECSLKVVIRNY